MFANRDPHTGARYLLASIRLVNGTVGLLAPWLFIRRFDPDHPTSPAAVYAFRLFGIRTVLLGLDLFVSRDEQLAGMLRQGILVHASDTATAGLLGLRRQVPPRTAAVTTAISAVNVVLALVASRQPRR